MTYRLTLQGVAILLLTMFSLPALAWWHCDWNYRFPIGISQPPGPAVTDYQVRVNLNAANVPAQFNWSLLGNDLRVVDQDDQTEINFYIERWNAAGQTAVIWVRVPTIGAGGRTVYVYFGAPPGTANASTPMTFTEPGLKIHTRYSTVDPANRAAAETAFNNASDGVPGYGCRFVDAYVNVSNVGLFSPPALNGNFGWFAEVFFDVTPAQAGVWEFRYGADFGLGGGLYVDDVALDEKWVTDLWWNFVWTNPSQILQGSANLSAGTHSFRILGFEGCCDGGLTAQFRRPGSATWLDMSLTNISLRSRKCPVYNPTVTIGPGSAATCPSLIITRTSQTLSDPVNGLGNPKPIPGAVVLNISSIRNSGTGPVNADTIVISEPIAANMALRVLDFDAMTAGPVRFNDGSPSSGLSYTFTALGDPGDDVAFSNDSGASFNYTPTPDANGVDIAVTNIRINPKNAFLGNSGSGDTSASFVFKAIVR
jgi:hypothetical protein